MIGRERVAIVREIAVDVSVRCTRTAHSHGVDLHRVSLFCFRLNDNRTIVDCRVTVVAAVEEPNEARQHAVSVEQKDIARLEVLLRKDRETHAFSLSVLRDFVTNYRRRQRRMIALLTSVDLLQPLLRRLFRPSRWSKLSRQLSKRHDTILLPINKLQLVYVLIHTSRWLSSTSARGRSLCSRF